MANLSKTTKDHEEIQRWAEERGGKPSHVKSTASEEDIGILRIDFPGFSGEGSLEEIPWDDFFEKFDARNLALVYQEETAGGERSNFNKLISGDSVDTDEEEESKPTAKKAASKGSAKKAASKVAPKKAANQSGGRGTVPTKAPAKASKNTRSAPAKKSASKLPAKKAAPAKKSAPPAKKGAAVKKGAPAKKVPAKKIPAKKVPAKKVAAKKTVAKKKTAPQSASKKRR